MNVYCALGVHTPLQDPQAVVPVRQELSRVPEPALAHHVPLVKLRQLEAPRVLLSFVKLANIFLKVIV
jgi:hypothetical protein